MSVIAIKCPECGAQLRVEDGRDYVTCTYCSTMSQVRRRTQIFEVPVAPRTPPPEQMPHGRPMRIVTAPHTGRFVGFGCLTAIFMIGGVGFAISKAARQAVDAIGKAAKIAAKSVTKGEQYTWLGSQTPVLSDVNGDGSADVIGRVRWVIEKDSLALAAFDGPTGRELWVSESLGSYMEAYQGATAVVSDLVVIGDGKGRVRGFGLADGKLRWTTQLDERTDDVCADGATPVIQLADKRVLRLDAKTGTATPLDGRPATCKRVWTSGKTPPDLLRRESSGDADLGHEPPSPAGDVWASLILGRVGSPGGPFVVTGYKKEGTAVGMVGVYFVEGEGKNQKVDIKWQVTIAGVEPLTSNADVGMIGFVENDVIASYRVNSTESETRLTAFALADGKRRWDVVVPSGVWSIDGFSVSSSHAFVSSSGKLFAFDLRDGRHLYTIGH